jgi:hypothetical protein
MQLNHNQMVQVFFTNRIRVSIIGLLILGSFSGCSLFFPSGCGLFGATTSYRGDFVLDKEFTPLEVQVGDTLVLRPARHSHINYTYTGSSSCDGKDYKDGPGYIHPNVQNDSLATAKEFYDGPDPVWENGSEMKVRIIGKAEGSTKLDLRITWLVEGQMDTIELDSSFVIALTVIEPN